MPLYCIQDPDDSLTLYGTRDDKLKSKDSAYFRIKIAICSEKTRLKGDPECASGEEIDKYLQNKKIRVSIIEKQLNLHKKLYTFNE